MVNLSSKEHGYRCKVCSGILEKGVPLSEFLEDFPGADQKQAEAVIKWSAKHFELPEIIFDETIIG